MRRRNTPPRAWDSGPCEAAVEPRWGVRLSVQNPLPTALWSCGVGAFSEASMKFTPYQMFIDQLEHEAPRARIAADSGLNGESPVASRSAFTNFGQSASSGRNSPTLAHTGAERGSAVASRKRRGRTGPSWSGVAMLSLFLFQPPQALRRDVVVPYPTTRELDVNSRSIARGRTQAMLLRLWRLTARRASAGLAFVMATASVCARASEPTATSGIEIAATQEGSDLAASSALDCSREGVRCIDGATLYVNAETRIQVLGLVPLKLGDPGDPMVLGREVRVLAGTLELDIPKHVLGKKGSRPFLIRTARGESAMLEHGHGIILAFRDAVTFAVPEGRMFTAQKERWSPLEAGRARSFSKAWPAGDERPLVSAPRLTHKTGLVLTDSDRPISVAIHLSPMPHAALYQVSIVQVTNAGPKPVTILTSTSSNVSTPPLPPGRYKARARAVDAYGLMSGNSAPLSFCVVGMKLPVGADVLDGKVQLGRGQRVQLLGAEHLEVSYGTMSQFVPAPSSLRLSRDRATTLVRLREGPNRPEVTVKLEPLGGLAKVELGPPRARWPTDRVSVTIRAFDSNEEPQRDTHQLVPVVLVNINRVHIDWVRRGNVLRGEVPPPAGRGPWVVRVLVRNRVGDELNRDFLEVTAVAPAI